MNANNQRIKKIEQQIAVNKEEEKDPLFVEWQGNPWMPEEQAEVLAFCGRYPGRAQGVTAEDLGRWFPIYSENQLALQWDYHPTVERLGLTPEDLGGEISVGRGCEECFQSGYSGRTAIYEFMPMDEEMRTAVMEGATATQLKRGAIDRGLITLRADGVDKVRDRLTTPDEILRVTQLDMG